MFSTIKLTHGDRCRCSNRLSPCAIYLRDSCGCERLIGGKPLVKPQTQVAATPIPLPLQQPVWDVAVPFLILQGDVQRLGHITSDCIKHVHFYLSRVSSHFSQVHSRWSCWSCKKLREARQSTA